MESHIVESHLASLHTEGFSSVEDSHRAHICGGGGGDLVNRYRFKRALVAQLVG
jgi:hypothetical protein